MKANTKALKKNPLIERRDVRQVRPIVSPKRQIKVCKIPDCGSEAIISDFCRLHYLKEWKSHPHVEEKRSDLDLDDFIEKLKKKYPKDYIEILKEAIKTPDQLGRHIKDIYENRDFLDANFRFYDEEIETILKHIKVEE